MLEDKRRQTPTGARHPRDTTPPLMLPRFGVGLQAALHFGIRCAVCYGSANAAVHLVGLSMPTCELDRLAGASQCRLADVCTHYGIARLELFGSLGRGNATSTSDVDLLYELEPGAQLGWEIERLTEELAEVFGLPADLISRRSLHERLRDVVLAEARLLYAA